LDAETAPATVSAALELRARAEPDRPCILFEGATITNAELWEQAGRIAGGLAGLGIGKGSRVALLLENEPRFYAVWFALVRLGAVQVPTNTAYFGDSLAHVLADSD